MFLWDPSDFLPFHSAPLFSVKYGQNPLTQLIVFQLLKNVLHNLIQCNAHVGAHTLGSVCINQKKFDVCFILVWLPLIISEECLADGSELIDVDRIVPEKEAMQFIKKATEFDFWDKITILHFKSFSLQQLLTHLCQMLQSKPPSLDFSEAGT